MVKCSPLCRNFLLLLSTGAALCLFLQPARIVIALAGLIFAAVAFTCLLERDVPGDKVPGAMPMAVCFALAGLLTFCSEWVHSSLLAALAGRVGLSREQLLYVLGAAGALAAFYAFWRLSCRLCRLTGAYMGTPAGPPDRLLLISAGCFLLAEPVPDRQTLCSLLAGLGVISALSRHTANLWTDVMEEKRELLLFSILTTLGICFYRMAAARPFWDKPLLVQLLCLAGGPFVFLCVICFFRWLLAILEEAFEDISLREGVLFAILALALVAVCVLVFLKTDAFYGTDHPYDVIYTSDSHILVEGNAWLNLKCDQNDLRQPLYAVFAAPFVGFGWLLTRLVPQSPVIDALALNIPQILILLLSHWLLCRALDLKGGARMAFFAAAVFSYPSLLFSLMMEQYIFVYFYTVLLVYLFARDRKSAPALWGAGGTLLTSLVLLPTQSDLHPVKDFRRWFTRMLNGGLGFVTVLLAFGRGDILVNAGSSLVNLSQFTGEKLTLPEKALQFTTFPASCLTAPAAAASENLWGILSWQLIPARSVHPVGLVILVLCLLGGILLWKDRLSRLSLVWIGFSLVLLLGLGWGTQENGLVLYSLYFGWAYLAVLQRLSRRFVPRYTAALWTAAAAAMALVNLPAMARLIAFALEHYPL